MAGKVCDLQFQSRYAVLENKIFRYYSKDSGDEARGILNFDQISCKVELQNKVEFQ